MNKASGSDGIPVEVFQILKNDAVRVLHSTCQSAALNMPANLENSAVATEPEKVSFHSNPKERQCQRCSNYRTCAFGIQPSSVHSLSHVRLFDNPWTAACQDSLSITNSRSLLELMSSRWYRPTILSSVIPFSSHPQSFPESGSSNQSALCIRWPKYLSPIH